MHTIEQAIEILTNEGTSRNQAIETIDQLIAAGLNTEGHIDADELDAARGQIATYVTRLTAIDVRQGLAAASDEAWGALVADGDYDGQDAYVEQVTAKLAAAADDLGMEIDFSLVGSPEAVEWDRKHGLTDDDAETIAHNAAKVWDLALGR